MNDHLEWARRNLWAGIATFALVFGALALLALNASETYRARALILFTLGREFVYVPETDQSGVKAPNPGDFQGVVNAEMLLLDDPDLRREAVEAVGLERAYPGIAAAEIDGMAAGAAGVAPDAIGDVRLSMAADALRNATGVSLVTGSYVVAVAVSHDDPVIAAELANALTDAYFEKRRRIYFEREIETLRGRLGAAQVQAVELRDSISALLDGEDPVLYENAFQSALSTRAEFETALARARVDLVVLEEGRRALEGQLASLDPVIVEHRDYQPDPVRQSRVVQIADLQGEYESAIVQLGASHPQAVALRGQIERARATLTEESDEVTVGRRIGPNPLWSAVEGRRIESVIAIEEARRRVSYLQDATDAAAAEIARYSQIMPQLSLLERGQADQAQRIVSLQSRLRESEALARTDERDNVRVIQEAVPPTNATSMPLRIRLVIAGAVAAMAAVAVMLALTLLGRRPVEARHVGAVPARSRPATG